jgi:hypothetical protein
MLICRIRALSPSTTSNCTATRLRSSGVMVDLISTAYLPRLKYCRCSSCSALSSRARSSTRPSARPVCLRPAFRSSSENSLMPEGDRCDRGALFDGDDHHAIARLQPHIPEKTGGVKRLDRRRRFLVGHQVADLDRQVAEYRPRLGALDALDPDVLDDKRLLGKRGLHGKHSGKGKRQTVQGSWLFSSADQALQIIEQGKGHQQQQECQADPAAYLHGAFGHRATGKNFGHIIHEVPPIQ